MKPLSLPAALFLACLATIADASGVIIASTQFEGGASYENGYYYTYNFDYAGYGTGGPNVDLMDTAVVSSAAQTAGVGLGGSGALYMSWDASAVPDVGQNYPGPSNPPVQYNYYGVGTGHGLAIKAPMTSPNLADYRLSLDMQALGLLAPSLTVELELEFQAPDDTITIDGDTNNDVILALEYVISSGSAFLVGPSFGTSTLPIDQYTNVLRGSVANFSQYAGNAVLLNVHLIARYLPTESDTDAGNALIIDNSLFEQVPEPATTSMLMLAAAGSALRRRRMS